MDQTENTEREFFRTEASLAVRFGPDTPEGRRTMAMDAEVWHTQAELEDAARRVLDDGDGDADMEPVLSVLRYLDYKVDLILHHLRAAEMANHFPYITYTTDISGSGLAVQAHPELRPGDSVIMNLALPDVPSRPIYAAAKVVRVEGASGGEAGLHLIELSDADRERLVRFTFAKQREALSRRNEEDEP